MLHYMKIYSLCFIKFSKGPDILKLDAIVIFLGCGIAQIPPLFMKLGIKVNISKIGMVSSPGLIQ